MTSEPIGGEFSLTRNVTTPRKLTANEARVYADLPAPGSPLKAHPEWELAKLRMEDTTDPLEWKVHLTYRKAQNARTAD